MGEDLHPIAAALRRAFRVIVPVMPAFRPRERHDGHPGELKEAIGRLDDASQSLATVAALRLDPYNTDANSDAIDRALRRLAEGM